VIPSDEVMNSYIATKSICIVNKTYDDSSVPEEIRKKIDKLLDVVLSDVNAKDEATVSVQVGSLSNDKSK
jgi:hypothetical protein